MKHIQLYPCYQALTLHDLHRKALEVIESQKGKNIEHYRFLACIYFKYFYAVILAHLSKSNHDNYYISNTRIFRFLLEDLIFHGAIMDYHMVQTLLTSNRHVV